MIAGKDRQIDINDRHTQTCRDTRNRDIHRLRNILSILCHFKLYYTTQTDISTQTRKQTHRPTQRLTDGRTDRLTDTGTSLAFFLPPYILPAPPSPSTPTPSLPLLLRPVKINQSLTFFDWPAMSTKTSPVHSTASVRRSRMLLE